MSILTIQPSNIDNFLNYADQSTNYGTELELHVGDRLGVYTQRSLLKFDFSALPDGAVISAAALGLNYWFSDGDPVGETYWAYRLTQIAWTEIGSTWAKYDGYNYWATGGGDYTATDGASITMPASYGWVSWNVLAQVQYAQLNVSKVAHFLIKSGTAGSYDTQGRFHSNNYTTDTTLCPKLVITYAAGGFSESIAGILSFLKTKIRKARYYRKQEG